jgi:diaminopimelate decarboxylase
MMTYQHRDLFMEACAVRTLAEGVPTPFYAYSQGMIETQARAYQAMAGRFSDAMVCYAVKANNHPAILSLLAAQGLGADVVSRYELRQALMAGIPPHKIVFSGVGKTAEEIQLALSHRIAQINVESLAELEVIQTLAAAHNHPARIALRINPNVDADTHAKITTGKEDNKFGVPLSDLPAVIGRVQSCPHLHWQGLAVHIGSQIVTLAPYQAAYTFVMQVVRDLAGHGIVIDHLDLGGGIGIAYDKGPAFTLDDYGAMVQKTLGDWSGKVIFEPGRFLVGAAGALITEVLYIKETPKKRFAIVNAAMTDLIRPALYDAVHRIVPVHQSDAPPHRYDVVGPVCETGDILGRDVPLPPLHAGDLLAILDAGAYGSVLASHYNMRSFPAEVMVSGEEYGVITHRQTFEDLNRYRQVWAGPSPLAGEG